MNDFRVVVEEVSVITVPLIVEVEGMMMSNSIDLLGMLNANVPMQDNHTKHVILIIVEVEVILGISDKLGRKVYRMNIMLFFGATY